VWIMHYDNNYPGEERHIEVDKKPTLAYTTAADPNGSESGYKGDADTKTLTIAPSGAHGRWSVVFCGSVDGRIRRYEGLDGAPVMREI